MNALISSMRLRTLPLSLAGVVCGGVLALGKSDNSGWIFFLTLITACLLQILSNLSNELGDNLNGVDGEQREGPNYGMSEGLTIKQMWRAINTTVVLCAISGLAMLLLSYKFAIVNFQFALMLALGAAAIWAATHYTLGKNPYGYKGLGDLFVFIFFGLVSVLGSYFVIAHTIDFKIWLIAPAIGMGLLSVAVLNVNNIRDMQSDMGIRRTIPLRIGERKAKWYQTILVVLGAACFIIPFFHFVVLLWFLIAIPVCGFVVHLSFVWTKKGKSLDLALPILVFSSFVMAITYSIICHGLL